MDLSTLNVDTAREAVQLRKTTAMALVESFYEKIQKEDGLIGAYLTLCKERAMAQADRMDRMAAEGKTLPPLGGVPVAVKDVMCTAEVRTTAGSKVLGNFIPPYDSTAVARLEAAGAIVLGKLNCDEFAMGSSNENSAFHPVRNPRDPSRVPGGSSGGSAAAVAADMADTPLALSACCIALLIVGFHSAARAQSLTSQAVTVWLREATPIGTNGTVPVYRIRPDVPALTVAGVCLPKVLVSNAAAALLTSQEMRTALRHGFFVYNSTLHIPLIVRLPSAKPHTVSEPVSTADILPSLLEEVSLPIPAQVQGASFAAVLDGKADAPAARRGLYAETFLPRLHFNWSELRGIQFERYKFIEAPRPELYDLEKDPKELQNLFDQKKAVATEMRSKLSALVRTDTPSTELAEKMPLDPALLERLKALGYAGFSGGGDTSAKASSLPDPKDRIQVYELISDGMVQVVIATEVEARSVVDVSLRAVCHTVRFTYASR